MESQSKQECLPNLSSGKVWDWQEQRGRRFTSRQQIWVPFLLYGWTWASWLWRPSLWCGNAGVPGPASPLGQLHNKLMIFFEVLFCKICENLSVSPAWLVCSIRVSPGLFWSPRAPTWILGPQQRQMITCSTGRAQARLQCTNHKALSV